MKKLFAFLLSVTLILSVVPFAGISVSAETTGEFENLTYTVENDRVTITRCDPVENVPIKLSIPSEIDGHPVVAIGNGAFSQCHRLKEITLSDSITSIGDEVFLNTGIERIFLPKSIKNIGSRIFSGTYGTDIWYEGTESDRENISISQDNENFLSAQWHYNTCRINEHVYDDSMDTVCNKCGWQRLPDIEAVEIKDLSIPENDLSHYGTRETYDSEAGEYESHFVYEFSSDLEYTIKMKDGTEFSGKGSNIELGDEYCFFDITDNQLDEPWTLGGTYTVTAVINAYGPYRISDEYSFSVHIVENPQKPIALSVEDTAIMEGMYDAPYAEGEIYAPDFTLTLADGTVIRSQNGMLDGEEFFLRLTYSDEKPSEWKVGETHTVTASVMDLSDTFNVTVKETIIDNIEFADTTVIANAIGEKGSVYNSETGKSEEYFKYSYHPDFTITFKDGTKETISYPTGLFSSYYSYKNYAMGGGDSIGMFPIYTDTQPENHWVPGGVYSASASFMGFSGDFNVTVIENPVESIVPDEMYVVKKEYYCNWYKRSAKTGQPDFSDPADEPTYTVTLKDGTVIKSVSDARGTTVTIYGEVYRINSAYELDSSLGRRDMPITVSAFGKTYDLTASVEVSNTYLDPNEIEKVEIEDCTAIKTTDGLSILPEYTVYMKDGRKLSRSEVESLYIGSAFSYNVDYNERRSWQVGESHTVTGSFDGFTDEFIVTVVENPIVGPVENDITCTETVIDNSKTFSYDKVSGQYRYTGTLRANTLSFKLKDGNTITACRDKYGSLYINLDGKKYYMTEQSYELQYSFDKKYDEYVCLFGKRFDFSITFTEYRRGDLSGDGDISSADALVTLQNIVGLTQLDKYQLKAGDVDGDGSITTTDALMVLQFTVGIIDKFPSQE